MDSKLLLIMSLTMVHVFGEDQVEDTATPKARLFNYKYRNTPIHQTVIRPFFSQLDKGRMEQIVKRLSLFHSRYAGAKEYSGPNQAEGWLITEIKSILAHAKYPGIKTFSIPDSTLKTETDRVRGRPYYQENIIVTLEGHDPVLKSELVILGAHYDSVFGFGEIDWKRGRAAPGADDNATGVAVLLEVLRLIAQFGLKLKHTVEFHFYTAKETELRGSQDVVKKYREEGKRVKGMLNLDSLGYRPDPNLKQIAGTVTAYKEHEDSVLAAFVQMLVENYLDVHHGDKYVDYRQGWFSDHYSWYLEGFPSAFVTAWETNPNNHREDVWDNISFEMVNEFAKLGLAFLIELGELSEMPVMPQTTPSLAGKQNVGLSLFMICLVLNL